MDYKYTLSNLDDAIKEINQVSKIEHLYEILDNSDLTAKLLLIDFLYNSGLNDPIKEYFNLSKDNRLVSYLYAKHVGVDFTKAVQCQVVLVDPKTNDK